MIKKVYLDVETTGTNEHIHGIRQLSALIEVPGKPTIVFDEKIEPGADIEWDDWVLENMATPAEYVGAPTQTAIYSQFIDVLDENCNRYNKKDKYFFYAYNAPFDWRFMRKLFTRENDRFFGSWFFTPPIDVMGLAGEALKERRSEMKDFKLMTVAQELGIPVDEGRLHDSLYDIELTRMVHARISKTWEE